MFRRFGVKFEHQPGEQEILLNLNSIAQIIKNSATGKTYICLNDGTEYVSTVDYEHLAAALDGMRC